MLTRSKTKLQPRGIHIPASWSAEDDSESVKSNDTEHMAVCTNLPAGRNSGERTADTSVHGGSEIGDTEDDYWWDNSVSMRDQPGALHGVMKALHNTIITLVDNNHTMLRSMNMKPIPKDIMFSGGSSEDAEDYLCRLVAYAKYLNLSNDDMCKLIPLTMKNRARFWFKGLSDETKENWTLLQKAVTDKYGAASRSLLYESAQLDRTQRDGESIESYADDMAKRFQMAGTVEPERHKVFIRGLHYKIRAYVIDKDPKCFETADKLARRAEEMHRLVEGCDIMQPDVNSAILAEPQPHHHDMPCSPDLRRETADPKQCTDQLTDTPCADRGRSDPGVIRQHRNTDRHSEYRTGREYYQNRRRGSSDRSSRDYAQIARDYTGQQGNEAGLQI